MSTYRPNAAIIVTDGNGRVLLCERADLPGAVQTVQGGIDTGETPLEAAQRELTEEIGLRASSYEIVSSIEEPMRYTWPEELRDRLRSENDAFASFEGQEQYFFLARVAPDVTFDLDVHVREFSNVWWGTPKEMVDGAWEYKKPNLSAALTRFGLL